MQSMTAFAAHTVEHHLGKLTCEIRSVNQRFLDLTIKCPDFLRSAESHFRKRFNQLLSRGKVTVFIKFFPHDNTSLTQLGVNKALLKQLLGHAQAMADEFDLQQNMGTSQFMNWPEVITQQPTDASELHQAAIQLVNESIAQLLDSRSREGAAMLAVLQDKAQVIADLTQEIRSHAPVINQTLEQKFRDKLAEIDIEVNPERFEQELALQLQKIDITEELDRLDAHVAELNRILDLNEPVGRRLDFLVQELNRESNTIGSKSASIKTTNASIDLKVAIEQMREQIQNIE
ncbi:YicC/YloC family endoribonuclease [Marinicella meishanensis]|uniref:YicC/YloC family endoribonuclease n=1 Tax=Marinicella meishanensis TaxID=2873263 RepID=UPI001CBF9B2B|nr:YicC/YloC family endoribonuclease [Marinicella sp. NBU2979]